MMHFIIGFILIITLVLLAFGPNLGTTFQNFSSVLIILGTALGGGLMAAGPRAGSAIRAAFAAIFAKEASQAQLRNGIRTFRTARFTALAGGFFTAVGGMILVIKNIDDPSGIGPSMSLALEGLFWGVLIGYFVLLPLQANLESRLLESEPTRMEFSETPLDLLVLSGGFVFGGIFLALTNYLF